MKRKIKADFGSAELSVVDISAVFLILQRK